RDGRFRRAVQRAGPDGFLRSGLDHRGVDDADGHVFRRRRAGRVLRNGWTPGGLPAAGDPMARPSPALNGSVVTARSRQDECAAATSRSCPGPALHHDPRRVLARSESFVSPASRGKKWPATSRRNGTTSSGVSFASESLSPSGRFTPISLAFATRAGPIPLP